MTLRHQEVVCAFIIHEGTGANDDTHDVIRLLCAQRYDDAEHFPSMYEFPGGKVDAGESHVSALRRECREELGIDIDIVADARASTSETQATPCYAFDHAPKEDKRSGGTVLFRLSFYWARIRTETGANSEPKALASQKVEWLTAEQMKALEFCPGDEGIIEAMDKGTLRPHMPLRIVAQ